MDLLVNGMERFPWLVPAICDLLALATVAGAVRLMRPATSGPSPKAASETPSAAGPLLRIAPEPARPAVRADVSRALDAIGQWERHHGSSRGITELARWVEGQKKVVSAR